MQVDRQKILSHEYWACWETYENVYENTCTEITSAFIVMLAGNCQRRTTTDIEVSLIQSTFS